MPDDLSRRDFVSTSSKLALGGMIVPSHVLAGRGHQAPSDTLNVAIVGAGGMGGENAQELGSENIVAVCDLDHELRYDAESMRVVNSVDANRYLTREYRQGWSL